MWLQPRRLLFLGLRTLGLARVWHRQRVARFAIVRRTSSRACQCRLSNLENNCPNWGGEGLLNMIGHDYDSVRLSLRNSSTFYVDTRVCPLLPETQLLFRVLKGRPRRLKVWPALYVRPNDQALPLFSSFFIRPLPIHILPLRSSRRHPVLQYSHLTSLQLTIFLDVIPLSCSSPPLPRTSGCGDSAARCLSCNLRAWSAWVWL
jgi:hypothetical protein